jgi:hypothetical protein
VSGLFLWLTSAMLEVLVNTRLIPQDHIQLRPSQALLLTWDEMVVPPIFSMSAAVLCTAIDCACSTTSFFSSAVMRSIALSCFNRLAIVLICSWLHKSLNNFTAWLLTSFTPGVCSAFMSRRHDTTTSTDGLNELGFDISIGCIFSIYQCVFYAMPHYI